jgi:hypothetical protein
MADLRIKYLEDYAGGLLNVSRQELSSNGEVLVQDGFLTDNTIFIEDGVGVKSGLKLGVGLAECVDPTTNLGIVNVRYADRTYSKIRDVKIFTMAISSAQAALSEAVAESIQGVENVLDSLSARIQSSDNSIVTLSNQTTVDVNRLTSQITQTNLLVEDINTKVTRLISSDPNPTSNITFGYNALKSLKLGIQNIAIGYDAAPESIEGNNNIFIGNKAGFLNKTGSNNIYLGSDTRGSGSNEIILGNSSHKVIKAFTDIFTPARNDIDLYTYNSFPMTLANFKLLLPTLIYDSDGDLVDLSLDPESVRNALSWENSSAILYTKDENEIHMSKTKLIPVVIQAMKTLITTVEELETRIFALENP